METDKDKLTGKVVYQHDNSTIKLVTSFTESLFLIESDKINKAEELFYTIYSELKTKEGETEPMLNLLAWKDKGQYILALFLRKKHRPSCFFEEGDGNILLSPASVDMGGVFITPLEKDFNKMELKDIITILDEVCESSEVALDVGNRVGQKLKT